MATSGIHKDTLYFLWGPIMNLVLFFSFYAYRPYAILIHSISGFLIGVFTMSISFPILIQQGFPLFEDPLFKHFTIGSIIMLMITLTLIFGILLRVMNVYNFTSSKIVKMKLIHKVIGYLTLLLAKSLYLIVSDLRGRRDYFYGLLGMDIATIILIIIRKTTFPDL